MEVQFRLDYHNGVIWDYQIESHTSSKNVSASTIDLEPGTYLIYERFAKWIVGADYSRFSGCFFSVEYEGKSLQVNESGNTFNEIILTQKGKLTFKGWDTTKGGDHIWEYFFIRIK